MVPIWFVQRVILAADLAAGTTPLRKANNCVHDIATQLVRLAHMPKPLSEATRTLLKSYITAVYTSARGIRSVNINKNRNEITAIIERTLGRETTRVWRVIQSKIKGDLALQPLYSTADYLDATWLKAKLIEHEALVLRKRPLAVTQVAAREPHPVLRVEEGAEEEDGAEAEEEALIEVLAARGDANTANLRRAPGPAQIAPGTMSEKRVRQASGVAARAALHRAGQQIHVSDDE